jgi:ribonuclease HI
MTLPADLPEVIIYTDGACDPNPGPGGWAALLRFGDHEKELTGANPDTTNNRMELQAVIAALDALKRPCRVRLHTDSEYVQKGVTEWMARWKAKGWKKVANRDLWEALDASQQRHQIEWEWVRGHAGDPLNERVDRLAVSMIPRSTLPLDDPDATHLFTGVSCLGTDGPGGWAVIVRSGEATQSLSGYEAHTSANRLQLLAAAEGLKASPAEALIHLYTPSDYVVNGAQFSLLIWATHHWRKKHGEPVRNKDLWEMILAALQTRRVIWHSLKSEARPDESRQAEELAQRVARQEKGADEGNHR